jgi:VWFA-related protein
MRNRRTHNPLPKAQVLISLSDKDGNPLSPVIKDQFTVLGNHKPVQVLDLRPMKDEPLVFAVLVDVSGFTKDKVDFERQTILDLFVALATGSNHGSLNFFNDESKQPVDYTNQDQLGRVLKTVPWGRGGTALYDAIIRSCTHELSSKSLPIIPRRVLFVITDGEDNSSRVSVQEAIEQAQTAGVPVFLILTSSPGLIGLRAVRELTRKTGGFAVRVEKPAEFVPPLLTVLNEEYLLTLGEGEPKRDKLRPLEVKPNDSKVKVIAPSQYYAP